MNTYVKFCPNVYIAKCEEPYQKGDTIIVTTKRDKENESIVFNLIKEQDGFYYYSIVRADGFNVQEHAKRKAERLNGYASTASANSANHYNKSREETQHLPLGQPILVGHHSEKAHRKMLERSDANMGKSVEYSKKAASYESRAAYWESKQDTIDLSMPESIEYFEFKYEQAVAHHEGLKDGSIPRQHSFDVPYANKARKELEKKVNLAKRLWG